ncbi:MAG: sigma-54-dependent Fis family transcriptional regulator [Calditrichaeota bacterium]|nr:MAG: sigma-54-dependent Fis family transcriptional regulator [Calditrichota bacterium]
MKDRILIVEDDINTLNGLAEILEDETYEVVKARSAKEALQELRGSPFNVVLLDYLLPDQDGLELARILLEEQANVKIIMMTAFGSVKNAVHAMKLGIYDYLTKPINLDELLIIIRRALDEQRLISENIDLKSKIAETYRFENIIGFSGKMQEVFQKIVKVANTDATVLLRGESGTGKELIARAIHYQSSRRDKPLVEINCASIPENLLESELFGHEKGSFTGAYRMKKGKFELAHEGTLFLDEIGELSMALQAKLLRVLQEQRFSRVGGVTSIEVDVRLIAATNADLEALMQEGRFREDLYYRLNVVPIFIPPLRDRLEDIGPLTDHFIQKYAKKNNPRVRGISEAARKVLLAYDWPGNVRELENAIENAIIMCEGEFIEPGDLPAYLQTPRQARTSLMDILHNADALSYREKLEACEREIIRQALIETGGNKTQAAKRLGFTIRTLRNKLRKYNM